HGAPGVVIARLAALVDRDAAAELEIAVATTLAANHQATHTLCHGEVGNLAIVAHAAARLGRGDWRAAVARRLPALREAIAAGRIVDCAFADAARGLMTGLAGVGHGLLVLAQPDLPLVLALDPPVRAMS